MTLPGRPLWWRDAACREQPLDLFFPAPGRSAQPARNICATCTALHHCHTWAMSEGDWLDGIFAGLTRSERDRRRRSA